MTSSLTELVTEVSSIYSHYLIFILTISLTTFPIYVFWNIKRVSAYVIAALLEKLKASWYDRLFSTEDIL